MNRKVLLLNLALIALAATLGWQLRVRWLDARTHERTFLSRAPSGPPVLPPPPAEIPKAVTPADYIDVAQKTLFSKDRNPNVIVEPPPPAPAPPPAPMPALPAYHGQMAIAEPVVLLSLPQGQQKSYHVGEQAGPFQIVAFDRDNITLDWNGKTVERKLSELAPKEPTQPAAAAQAPVAVAAAPPKPAAPKEPGLGVDMGGFRACVAGDTSPAGTVFNGYRKVVAQSLMGPSCHWEQVK